MNQIQWNWLQSFIEVANSGSLSGAAISLGVSQPTLSRHMSALEACLGTTLFNRSTQGLVLTESGAKLLERSLPMQEAADGVMRAASGIDETLTGTIRISANEVIGLYYLPPLIARFNDLYPEVHVEIDISNRAASLSRRDADIALRMFRPTQPDLIARRLLDIPLRFCASRQYLSTHGRPESYEQLSSHRLLGFDRDNQMINAAKSIGVNINAEDFINRSDFLPLHIEMARQGAGIAVSHLPVIKAFPELELLLPDIPIPNLEFWLVCHSDVRHNRKIRTMVDFLAEHL